MTSPSLKNHPTTALLKATRSETRSVWKQMLAGALCLCVAGSIVGGERDSRKPLDRLRERSGRQRWRELRGEWHQAPEVTPQNPPAELPQSTSTPIPAQVHPVVEDAHTIEPWVAAPVPGPIETVPEVDRQALTLPKRQPASAKPAQDFNEPVQHSGSFADTLIEQHVSTPRERQEIPLPHWPFGDDLDLVGSDPFVGTAPAPALGGEVTSTPIATSSTELTPLDPRVDAEPVNELPRLKFPVQVAEAEPANSTPVTEAPAPVDLPKTPPASLPGTLPEAALAKTPQPEADPVQQLKSIRQIDPFYDYSPNRGDPNETLCPRPANADPQKTYDQCPTDAPLVPQGSLERNHSVIPVYWQASNVTHNPLYFEDPGLERSGHTFSELVQPFVSVGRFGAQVATLPYSIALDPMWQQETPLGHYRPGECAPKRHLAVPLNCRAAATAAAAYTGIIFLIP